MPFTSTHVSGLVGGQQVMFANQHAYAQSIGYGGGQAPQMSNPYPISSPTYENQRATDPNMGARIAGGMGMAMPGMVAGTTMAASLLGYKSPLGLLDPFTGISRAFGAGTGGSLASRAGVMAGSEGLGLMRGMRNIGGAFASGGLRAGGAALAGGLTGAAAAFVPYYVAGKAIETIGSNIFQGAQNITDVGRMAEQYMDPQFGRPGAAAGGKPGRGQVRQITRFLGELASQDVTHDMQELRRVMDRAGQMGMLEGVGSVDEFKRKFRRILGSTKAVAQVMGSSLEEAMPLVRSMQRMGTWTATDVMGIATEARAMGPRGAQAMMGAMQTGAQMAYARGGNLREGALAGRQLFGQVTAARQAGIFSDQDISNFTGGVGGAEGRQMMAGAIQQVTSGMGQTAMGRLMMAGLGEIREGQFTGRMDPERLRRFQRGELSINQLQSEGRRRVSTRSLATSFFNRADQMGQSLMAQGGIETMATGIQRAMERAGYGEASEPIQNRFIQLLTGAGQRQADMIQKMIQELPRIQAERTRRMEAALTDSFRQLENRRRGWTGLKEAIGGAWERGVERPLQELGERFSTSMGETFDRWAEKLGGQVREMPQVSQDEINRMLSRGTLDTPAATLQELGVRNAGQSLLTPGGLAGISMDIGRQGIGMRTARRAVSGLVGMAAAPFMGAQAGVAGLQTDLVDLAGQGLERGLDLAAGGATELAGRAGTAVSGLFGGVADWMRGLAEPARPALAAAGAGPQGFDQRQANNFQAVLLRQLREQGGAPPTGAEEPGFFEGMAGNLRRGTRAMAGRLEGLGTAADEAIRGLGGMVAGGLQGIDLGDLTGGFLGPVGEGFMAQGPGGGLSRVAISAREGEQMNARVRALIGAGMEIERGPAGEGEVPIGGGFKTTWAQAQEAAKRAVMRAEGASIEGLLEGETDEKRKAQNVVNSAMRRLMSDPRKYKQLKDLKRDNPEGHAEMLMRMVQDEGGPEVKNAVKTLTKNHPQGDGSVGAILDVGAIATREIGRQGGDLGPDFKATADLAAGVALGSPEEIQKAQNELIDEMVGATGGGGAFGGVWQSIGAGAATGAAAGAVIGGGIGSIPLAGIGAVLGAGAGFAGWMMSDKMSAAEMKEGLLGDATYAPADVAAWARVQGAGEAAKPEDVEAARRFQEAQGEAATRLREYISDMSEEERQRVITGAETMGAFRKKEADLKLGERFKRFAKAAGPVGDIKGVSAEAEERIEAARASLAGGADFRGGLRQLTRAGTELTERELGHLRRGRGGALGQDVALLQDIERMGEMSAAQFQTFRKRKLGGFGESLISSYQGTLRGEERQQFEEMLKGGIQGEEVAKFKDIMKRMATGAVGLRAGGGGKDPFMEQMTAYTKANRDFINTVGQFLGKEELQAQAEKMRKAEPAATKGAGR